jgi:hypothetical protein
MSVGWDVCGVQQFNVPQVTDGALLAVRLKHVAAELLLVEPLQHGSRGVLTAERDLQGIDRHGRYHRLVGHEHELVSMQ